MYLNCRITFTCVNKIEATYESPRVNVKVEPHSNFTFIQCLSLERSKVTFKANVNLYHVTNFLLNLRFYLKLIASL